MKPTKRNESGRDKPSSSASSLKLTGKQSNRSRQEVNDQSASNSSLSSSSQEMPSSPVTTATTNLRQKSQPTAATTTTTTTTKKPATSKRIENAAITSNVSTPSTSRNRRDTAGKDLALDGGAKAKQMSKSLANNVIDNNRQRQQKLPQPPPSASEQRHTVPTTTTSSSSSSATVRQTNKQHHQQLLADDSKRRQISRKISIDKGEDTSSSSQEMTTTTTNSMRSDATLTPFQGGNIVSEQETNLDSQLDSSSNKMNFNAAAAAAGSFNDTDDDECATLHESPKIQSVSGIKVSDNRDLTPSASDGATMSQVGGNSRRDSSPLALYHDDEEINYQSSSVLLSGLVRLQPKTRQISSTDDDYEEDDLNELLSNGAALTMADDDQITALHSEEISFVVYPLGCCEFDETQLVSATSTRAIQKCILRLSNKPTQEEAMCWGLGQSSPILMRLLEDHIQFTDISSQTLLRSQPIHAIKTWAVDDDNNFAFVVEENPHEHHQSATLSSTYSGTGFAADNSVDASLDYALLNGPMFVCYVFRSMDDDDMSCRVAAKLNEQITRHREEMANRISKSTRLQQMVVIDREQTNLFGQQEPADDQTDLDADELDELVEATSETSMRVKYIGKAQVPRPMGIDVLNVAIDKCLADASQAQMNRLLSMESNEATDNNDNDKSNPFNPFDSSASAVDSPLIDANLHVSPSSVIVENVKTGEIIVECRIRYLTFMGISRRDVRWYGFIMQNTTNKTFVAHCFECHPTAGHVYNAIQASCSKMYEKVVKNQKTKEQQQQDATMSIMPNSSKIRDTLAKTLSRLKFAPIIG